MSDRLRLIERYAVSATAGYYVVTDSEQPAHAPTIAKCDRLDDARRIVSALNADRGAVDRADAAYDALVDQLGSHKLAEIAMQRKLEAKRAAAGGQS